MWTWINTSLGTELHTVSTVQVRTIAIVAAVMGLFTDDASSASIVMAKRNATVWSNQQVISGRLDTLLSTQTGVLYVNGIPNGFTMAPDSTFTASVHLGEGINRLVAAVSDASTTLVSDTLVLTLGYKLRPEIFARAVVSGGNAATLRASILENPTNASVFFQWSADIRNPGSVIIESATDSVASITIPNSLPRGEYYFDVRIVTSTGDTANSRTFVTLTDTGIVPFNIRTDHAQWIDSAIVYGITPYIFVQNGKFTHITAKLPEIKSLGVTAIWIQPVYATYGRGQGYDITDYFAVRPDLGTPQELRTLVETAHANGLKVLFDFVPNHSAIQHPYAQQAIQYGSQSHYYNFYQRAISPPGTPYRSDEHTRTDGNMTFVYYFWNSLVNFNYDNPEVQRMIIEAGRHWIREYDIDGYRIDAVWAPNARRPSFMKDWRFALKQLKPEILLIGEDKASQAQAFDEKFDAAYDWTSEYSWVSHWVWQTFYSASSNPTIFNDAANAPENQRASRLRNSLNNNGVGYAPNATVFRFLENNDTFRFRATHDDARTRMAAALVNALHGIPLLYNGQEIGAATHPYSTSFIYLAASSMESRDNFGLFPYYCNLNTYRKLFPALYSNQFAEVPTTPSTSVFSFRRWEGNDNALGVINMAAAATSVSIRLPMDLLGLNESTTYYLTDLLSGLVISGTPADLDTLNMTVPGYTTRVFILADTIITVTSVGPISGGDRPSEFELIQNFPNPFNPSTVFSFRIPVSGHVTLAVYDLLGRAVATIVNEDLAAGTHTRTWNASSVASGVYFYRIEARSASDASQQFIDVRKLMLVK